MLNEVREAFIKVSLRSLIGGIRSAEQSETFKAARQVHTHIQRSKVNDLKAYYRHSIQKLPYFKDVQFVLQN